MYIKIVGQNIETVIECERVAWRRSEDDKERVLVTKNGGEEFTFMFTQEDGTSVFIMNNTGQTIDRFI